MEAEEEVNKQANTCQNDKHSSEYYTWSSVSGTETEDDVVSQEGDWVPDRQEESTEDEMTEDESDTCGGENEINYVDLENIHSLL